jgi:dTDP-4-amino-4,6-dideoxygalactose transaminase
MSVCREVRLSLLCGHEFGVEPVPYMSPMILDEEHRCLQDRIIEAAKAEGVPMSAGYGEALCRINHLQKYAAGQSFPITESITSRLLVIDPAPFIRTEQMNEIVLGTRKVFARLDALRAQLGQAPSVSPLVLWRVSN